MSRVLITGASGLLGRALMREFEQTNWETLGTAFSRVRGKLVKVDLTNADELKAIVAQFKPSLIVHAAAERRPDVVEHQEAAARKLNVTATEELAKLCSDEKIPLIYISTDYVFDGTSPPYKVDDKPNPLNKYGISKYEGEQMVLGASNDHIVLRVPILYGEVESLAESAVTILFEKAKQVGVHCKMDNCQLRFPTHCDDVAFVCRQIGERKLKDSTMSGIFHWSGNQQLTKYQISVAMCDCFGLSSDHIEPDLSGSTDTKRPMNAKLDTSRLDQLAIGRNRDFTAAIATVLAKFQ